MAIFTIGCYRLHMANDEKNITYKAFTSLEKMFSNTLNQNNFTDNEKNFNIRNICISFNIL